jgi:hypothetical protein
MLTIRSRGVINAPEAEAHVGIQFFNTTNSILKTVHDLFIHDYKFVACMIFLFSVIVPVLKGILLMYASLCKKIEIRKKMFAFVKAIGKWSMCDVFVVATFLAYLSTGSRSQDTSHHVSVMGETIDVNVLIKMSAHLEVGFYFFLTYCLVSLIALQLYEDY